MFQQTSCISTVSDKNIRFTFLYIYIYLFNGLHHIMINIKKKRHQHHIIKQNNTTRLIVALILAVCISTIIKSEFNNKEYAKTLYTKISVRAKLPQEQQQSLFYHWDYC